MDEWLGILGDVKAMETAHVAEGERVAILSTEWIHFLLTVNFALKNIFYSGLLLA
jgi:hypothetical protein